MGMQLHYLLMVIQIHLKYVILLVENCRKNFTALANNATNGHIN